eukprot:TRINITY_DN711_c0_g1_i1.p2 TRINITY_DN711_c0_g1~~TRINITY_DN711_c0_g1_i1.p2  ORF type:complete len:161 (-),score=33.45 TRINITY_DN711_c0_g1_i1:225-707(-)
MGTWKDRPRRFVEPPLVTSQECNSFKEGVAKEILLSHVQAKKSPRLQELDKHNTYFSYFSKTAEPKVWKEHQFTLEKIQDQTDCDYRAPRDTFHPKHTEAARKRCEVALQTRWQLRTSQNYGWYPPVDKPNMGCGKSSIFLDSCMDKSHLGRTSGAWTAR